MLENVFKDRSIIDLQLQPLTEPTKGHREVLLKETNTLVFEFIDKNSRISQDACVAILKTITSFNIDNFPNCEKSGSGYDSMIDLKPLNDSRELNSLFCSFNTKLKENGVFIGCVETYALRKKRIYKKYKAPFNRGYYVLDFIFKRVIPKVGFLKGLNFFITSDRSQTLSKTEILGRMCFCGFQVTDILVDDNLLYFAGKKIQHVEKVKNKKYSSIIKLKRVGKRGELFTIYKFRTMHPYAEYLQQYVFDQNGTKNGDKPVNDFRVTRFGKISRKLWIDELPSLFNLIKGDLTLIGIRPLSKAKFGMYPKHAQEARCKVKPGLMPPFYADIPQSFEELVDSEMKYLEAHEKNPWLTNSRYFFKITFNILFKGIRSR